MKYVIVPPDVILTNQASGERWKMQGLDGKFTDDQPYSMLRWLNSIPCQDPRLQSEIADRRAVRGVLRAFKDVKPGQVVAVEDAHHEAIKKTIERLPVGLGYSAPALAQFYAFDEEWLLAADSQDKAAARLVREYPELAPGGP